MNAPADNEEAGEKPTSQCCGNQKLQRPSGTKPERGGRQQLRITAAHQPGGEEGSTGRKHTSGNREIDPG